MFPTPNTKKIGSLRSLAIIYFELGIIVKKGHTINYCPWKTGDSAPSTPRQGLCARAAEPGGGGGGRGARAPPKISNTQKVPFF